MLGILEGPTELLPVSSSAHLALLPWFCGWDWSKVEDEQQKALEVSAHVGAAIALVVGQRRVVASELTAFDARRASVVALSFVLPALVGMAWERQIEHRLGGPAATATGLVAGSVAMLIADRSPQVRGHGEAGPADGIALGIAQAAALWPGVSRNGATLTAARARRFSRDQANFLSRTVALPVICGAALLKGSRLRKQSAERSEDRALAACAGAALGSTLVSQRLINLVERDRALWPYALYRFGLAAAIVRKLRRGA